ncbi:ABC transporter substrate-binding protein [uncultured Cardiobacterium sp.]|uniref:ABC transporter substrate-binding protein n=1 Tax=uncultured Cardiobacterium sp. TaxID=417619 RepID=UPI0026316702|nr:ABC transporter substrate-binding protein [uncultured Cardiobacterium sp.]
MRAVFFALLAACAFERVITPDWSLASSLTAMGFPPLAMGDKRIYPVWMSDPVQPPSVVDLGERYRPNRELLAQLPFSRVVDNFFYAHLREVYPPGVLVVDVLFDGGNEAPQQSWATYVAATQKLGDAIGERAAAEGYLQRVEAALAGYGREIRAAAPEVKRYAVVQFADARQLRIFAPNSLFRVAFALMGLEQADLGAGNRWGSRLIALPELAQLPEDTCLIIVGPFPQMTEAELARSYLWRRIGFGREHCLRKIPAVWLFGGPESVELFGRYLRGAMAGDDAAPLHHLHTP